MPFSVEQFQQMGYKAEGSELTPEVLAAAQYDTYWQECRIQAVDGFNERRPKRLSFAPLQGVGGTTLANVTGIFEPRPFGTDGTPPDWFAMVAASGATVAADVATWGAESASTAVLGTACTFKHRDGNFERVSAGTRMEVMRFRAAKGERWMCEVQGKGRYSQATETSFVPAAHPVAGVGQPFLGMACSLGAFAGAFAEAEISIENTVTPVEGGHASGYGNNIITGQRLMGRFVVIDDGTDWRGYFRNDATADVLAASIVMSTGAAGNVLTWTGNLSVVEQPETEYREGLGYITVIGEFVTANAGAALTLTQS